MADDNKDVEKPLTDAEIADTTITGYKQRQCGCLWIIYMIGGITNN